MNPFTPATQLAAQIRTGDTSPVEAVETYLDRIDQRNDDLNAYVTVLDEGAREAAQAASRAVEAGDDLGPLHGVPVAIKDLYAYKAGVRNTYGSVPFADHVPETDALVVERLEAAGAIVLGKTNTPEFGFKGVTDNLLFGPTSTPFDLDRNSGGSSGGSAAATAAGLAPFAQASDGGGSVRIPASCCGIYGIKPSFGRIPYEGRPDAFSAHTPFGNAGPVARTVADAALMLDAVCGPHPRDPMSVPDDGIDFSAAADSETDLDGVRVAYTPDFGIFTVEQRVAETVREAADAFGDAGATVEEVEVDFGYDGERIIEEWMTVSRVKFAAMAERLRDAGVDLLGEHRDDVSPELLTVIEGGPDVSGIEYKRTDEMRTAVFDAIQDVFDDYDLLVSPTLATLPPEHGGLGPDEVEGVPIDPMLGWFLTWPFNLTGHPAASLPAGLVDGLPVGLQLVGRRFADDEVLAASAAFERERPWSAWYDRFE